MFYFTYSFRKKSITSITTIFTNNFTPKFSQERKKLKTGGFPTINDDFSEGDIPKCSEHLKGVGAKIPRYFLRRVISTVNSPWGG